MTFPARMPAVLLAACLLSPLSAFAHALVSDPKPRTDNDAQSKVGPCGGVGRTSAPHTFTAGEPLVVTWVETIPHPGYYRISFSQAGDTNWQVLADKIENPPGTTATQSATLTLPSTPCTDCTLQLIQVMTEGGGESLYFSCVDIVLKEAGGAQPPAESPDSNEPPAGASPSPSSGEENQEQAAPPGDSPAETPAVAGVPTGVQAGCSSAAPTASAIAPALALALLVLAWVALLRTPASKETHAKKARNRRQGRPTSR